MSVHSGFEPRWMEATATVLVSHASSSTTRCFTARRGYNANDNSEPGYTHYKLHQRLAQSIGHSHYAPDEDVLWGATIGVPEISERPVTWDELRKISELVEEVFTGDGSSHAIARRQAIGERRVA